MRIVHPFEPVFDNRSRVLILGSFPSVRSREEGFYYGHPQNRFWRVIAAVYGEAGPAEGSRDSSISNTVPTDLSVILDRAEIRRVLCNGQTAAKLYHRYQEPLTGIPAVTLPSTSPLNASWSLDRLTEAWRKALEAE